MTVDGLTAGQRSAVLLYARGYSFREVAEIRFCSVHTVSMLIKQARSRYRAAGVDVSTQTKLLIRLLQEGALTVDIL